MAHEPLDHRPGVAGRGLAAIFDAAPPRQIGPSGFERGQIAAIGKVHRKAADSPRLAGGIFVARRVLHRIDAMTGTTQRIMAGDLSERLPVGRSGDELDRLAENLNAMLERIEALMVGLKEVSDNIAHDLKTPLTRLRNRAEEALAMATEAVS